MIQVFEQIASQKLNTIFTAVIALAALINIIIAAFMWVAMMKSLRLNRDIFKTSFRPYLGIIEPVNTIYDDTKYELTLIINNFGNVPAQNLILLSSTSSEIVNQLDSDVKIKSLIFPNEEIKHTISYNGHAKNLNIIKKTPFSILVRLSYYGEKNHCYETEQTLAYNKTSGKYQVSGGKYK